MLWTDIPIHVVDFEGSRESGVVEFGVVTLRHGVPAAAATRVCRPRGRLRASEIDVHGLAAADLADAEPFESEWPLFADLRASGVLAAHFSGTEHSLLRDVWPCARLSPDFLHPGRESSAWGPWIDTGRLAVAALPCGASAALRDVVATLGLTDALQRSAERWCPPERRCFHGALFDALASALVLGHLARDADGTPWTLVRTIVASIGDGERRDSFAQGQLF